MKDFQQLMPQRLYVQALGPSVSPSLNEFANLRSARIMDGLTR